MSKLLSGSASTPTQGTTSADHEIMLDSCMVGGENSVPEDGNPVPTPAKEVHRHSSTVPPDNPAPAPGAYGWGEVAAEPEAEEAVVGTWASLYRKKYIKQSGDYVECSNCGNSIRSTCKPPPSPKQVLWDKFQSRHYPVSTPDFKPRKNVEECEGYTVVFLSHARVYVFGDKYDIKKLRMLALRKMHRTLQVFQIYNKRIGDIVELVRYSYNMTRDTDNLRGLITHYVACNFEDMAQNDNFLELVEEGGLFVRDLAGLLLKRIK